jgi:hypothetical protein
VIGALMVSTMLVACSADGLVPPASIDNGAQVGSISPSRSLPPAPISQAPYNMASAPVSQASSGGYLTAPGGAAPDDGGHYLRAPDGAQPSYQSGSRTAPQATSQGRLPMIDSDEAMGQASRGQASGRGGQMSVPDDGVNMDAEFGFGPDESDVVGLAEEQDTDIAEGVGDQPVVDGIGTDAPVALQPRGGQARTGQGRLQPMSNTQAADDRVIVPPKRQGAGNGRQGATMMWDDRSPVTAPSRVPAGRQEVAMLRPNNPVASDEPMSEPDGAWQRSVMPNSEVACRTELRRLGVEFRDLPRISQGNSCGIDYPVKLSGLSGGIDVKPAVTLNCQVTLAFAKWVKNDLAISARTRYLTGIRQIQPMGGYSCRKMNNSRQRNNPMSEHARGNAIDIGAIVLKNGHDIDVRKKGLFSFREGGLLKSVRGDSCKYFNTVLGPGSNKEHWNHFHFDLRSRKAGRRYCD